MVDLNKLLADLRQELARKEAAIAALEALHDPERAAPSPTRRENRGRKSMGAAEREEVSARMKRYWAARRQDTLKKAARNT